MRNIDLHGVGHMSLPIIGSVVHGISTTLAHLDSEGHTLTPGVTELPATQSPLAIRTPIIRLSGPPNG